MIREADVAALLHVATEDVDIAAAPAERLVESGRRRVRRSRVFGVGAAVAAVAGAMAAIPLLGSFGDAPSATSTGPDSSVPQAMSCDARVAPALLPRWARGGFSDPKPKIPFVSSRNGDMVAILFAPIRTSTDIEHASKVLWVSRLVPQSLTPLRIEAHLRDSTTTVLRRVPYGPGPSSLQLAEPGCWELTLRWSGHVDTIDLFVAPR